MNVTIIGTGVYAKAISKVLLNNNCNVTFWTSGNPNDITVPSNILVTNSYKEAVKDSKLIFILTGSKYVESVLKEISGLVSDDTFIILGSKGINIDSTLLSDLLNKYLTCEYGIISGPTFAIDIASLEPLGFTLATDSINGYNLTKSVLNGLYLEKSDDLIATSLGGALKNAYAIGSGILSGFGYGDSIRCLYITKVLHEFEHIYKTLNIDTKHILDLSCVGDLILTCTSTNSRNFTFGTIFSMNKSNAKEEFLKNNTVEGYDTIISFKDYFIKNKIDTPIFNVIYDIVINDLNSKKLIDILIKED